MIAAVGRSSDGRGGGLFANSNRPTAVGGGGFAGAGTAAGTPTGVPSSGILEARNNRGSNVRIPYARASQMIRTLMKHATHFGTTLAQDWCRCTLATRASVASR